MIFKRSLMAGVAGALMSLAAGAACAQDVTIDFWNVWDNNRAVWMKQIIADFEAQNPGIKVNDHLVQCCNIAPKAIAAMAAGTAGDVIMLTRADIISLASKGALLPLDPYFTSSNLDLGIFLPAEPQAFVWDGQHWALPMPTVSGNDDLFMYNKDLFQGAGLAADTAPKTWDELWTAGKKTTQFAADGKVDTLGLQISKEKFIPWLYSDGGTAQSADLKTITFNSPQGVEALTWLTDYVNTVNHGIAAQNTLSDWTFWHGKLGMLFENVSFFDPLINKAGKDFHWGVGSIPYNSKNPAAKSTGVAGIQFGWGYVIPSSEPAAKREAAWKWLQFLTTNKKGTCYFMKMQGRPSPVRSCDLDQQYFAINPNWQDVLTALQTDVPFPGTPVQKDIVNAAWDGAAAALAGQQSPKAALDQAAQKAQGILDDFWSKSK